MGKWSFGSTKFSETYREHEKAVMAMTAAEVKAEWEHLGSPKLEEFELNYWSGGSGDGWVTIDNSAAKEYAPSDHPVFLFGDRAEFIKFRNGNTGIFQHWFHRACVLAARTGVPRVLPSSN